MKPRTVAPPISHATGFVPIDGEDFACIEGVDRMPPFLMSVTSDTDLWMFITSRGGLTAGRVDPDGSLFPYETVDRLEDAHLHTGPVTLIRIHREHGVPALWAPFGGRPGAGFRVERNLYKNVLGTRVIFEEVNRDLGLVFRARWAACDRFGWVRTVTLENVDQRIADLDLLDGVRNVLPWGAPLSLYQRSSSLVDAYKRTDAEPSLGLSVFSLTAKITDRAEAGEVLRANAVFTVGLPGAALTLSGDAVDAFLDGEPAPVETVLTGRRGNHLMVAPLRLEPGTRARWHLVADAGRSHVDLAALRVALAAGDDLDAAIERELRGAGENLRRAVAAADGLQATAREETTAHHAANVLFNIMRGGVFDHGHDVPTADFAAFLETRNRPVADRHAAATAALPAAIGVRALLAWSRDRNDVDLERLALEYLPLWFGRRHGDPSRPWNRFTVRVRHRDGSRALNYEGNWRDIFQNWEALTRSYPDFLPGIVAKFVNASTVDGYNPYRITRDGIDWEVVDRRDPWSYIGYWGDHQIVYLLRFLEGLTRHEPGGLESMLDRAIFSYADVPYRIRSWDAILADPHATIDYDDAHAARVAERVRGVGTDGRLAHDAGGRIVHVSLLEKLLVPALAKLSNLVPEAGIWMNTQRPEWNDANNALVGNGVSTVTLFHLRRYLAFLRERVDAWGGEAAVSVEVAEWFARLGSILDAAVPVRGRMTDGDRYRVLDALGRAFAAYRAAVYERGFSGRAPLSAAKVGEFCRVAIEHLDHAIRLNRRDDGLYHSYHLLEVSPSRGEAAVRPLVEMLEGQVAALASGCVAPGEAIRLVEALFESRLYREDQRSFLLYPEKVLPAFMERNRVPEAGAARVPLLVRLLEAGDASILERDAAGELRFHGDFQNARDLEAALDRLAGRDAWRDAVVADRAATLDLFESVFRHHAFTGRSGTMYGYEGLGCVYWHMVAKLLLAVQEVFQGAVRDGADEATRRALGAAYYRVRAGLGFRKTPEEFGAFPTDPYSHTPRHAGARQPGMTGQVKEEILTRLGELGVEVEAGCLRFSPALLRGDEFLEGGGLLEAVDADGASRPVEIPSGGLAFTLAQVPVVYRRGAAAAEIRVTRADGTADVFPGDRLDAASTRAILWRTGTVERVDVAVPDAALADF